MSELEYNLEIVLESLKVICATHEEKQAHFADQNSSVDENFDFIVLDFLPGALSAGYIAYANFA